jgi:predicted transcriptional regulator|tara:strand:+ start:676 stop:882 length:207 start_codon:yes stop_codon:yes gene_type:complete
MDLKNWLDRQGITAAEIGRHLGLSESAVSRHISGERFPGPEIMAEYVKYTHGEVTAGDFYRVRARRAA